MSRSDRRPLSSRTRAFAIVLGALGIMLLVVYVFVARREASIHNIYDELLLEGPCCTPYPALPGRGHVDVPADFEAQGGGVDHIAEGRADYGYVGNDLENPLVGESYEHQGLYLTILRGSSWGGDVVDIYADSGFARIGDGNGYCVRVNWTYSLDARMLERRMTFLRDDDEGRHQITAGEFLSATGLTRTALDAWADHVVDDLVANGYLEANTHRSRFSEDNVGEVLVIDDTDWRTTG